MAVKKPEVWDRKMARWFARKWGEGRTNRVVVRLARVRSDEVALDIGCGIGPAVRLAAARMRYGKAIGVDPSPAMLEIAEKRAARHPGKARISFHVAQAEKIPLPDGYVDVAWTVNALHHWADVARALAEVKRVLVPGGRFLVADDADKDAKCAHGHGAFSDPMTAVRMMRRKEFARVRMRKIPKRGGYIVVASAVRP